MKSSWKGWMRHTARMEPRKNACRIHDVGCSDQWGNYIKLDVVGHGQQSFSSVWSCVYLYIRFHYMFITADLPK
jgi:hypothetical protein